MYAAAWFLLFGCCRFRNQTYERVKTGACAQYLESQIITTSLFFPPSLLLHPALPPSEEKQETDQE